MKIKLPSNGVLGCKEVDMSIPCYRHVREISQANYGPDVIGYEFVKLLLADPTALERMTYQDKDYLLAIAVCAMHLNAPCINVTCKCGHTHQVFYNLHEQEVVDLAAEATPVVEKKYGEATYSYHFLSAAQQREIAEKAREDAKDEADYARLFEFYFTCATFGNPLTQDGFDKTADLNLTVYYSALLFHELCFHGVNSFVVTTCPQCQQPIVVTVPFEDSLTKWSSGNIVNEFIKVSDVVGGFGNFLDLSLSEVEQIKDNRRTGAI